MMAAAMQATARPIDSAPVRAASDAKSAAAGAGIGGQHGRHERPAEHEDRRRGRARQPQHAGDDRRQHAQERGEQQDEDERRLSLAPEASTSRTEPCSATATASARTGAEAAARAAAHASPIPRRASSDAAGERLTRAPARCGTTCPPP